VFLLVRLTGFSLQGEGGKPNPLVGTR